MMRITDLSYVNRDLQLWKDSAYKTEYRGESQHALKPGRRNAFGGGFPYLSNVRVTSDIVNLHTITARKMN